MTCATCDSTDRTVAVGEDKTIKVTVYASEDEAASTEDISDFTVFCVIAVADSSTPLEQLAGDIQNQTTARGEVWFTFSAVGYDPGTYDLEVWLDDGTGVHERVLDTTLTIDAAITVDWS
jgi:hypothetical protein